MSEPEETAVVGPDGTLILPSGLRRRRSLTPGTTFHVLERPDGVLELRPSPSGGVDREGEHLGAFWDRWWDEASPADTRQ